MSESAVQRGIRRVAEDYGWWTLKINLFGTRGIPDLLCARGGVYLWIEVKRPNAKPRPLQLKMHGLMRSYGMAVFVMDNVEEAELLLR